MLLSSTVTDPERFTLVRDLESPGNRIRRDHIPAESAEYSIRSILELLREVSTLVMF